MASIPLYDITFGLGNQALRTLIDLLKKAKAHPEAESLPSVRLYPDMLPLSTQILIASNFVKKAVERLVNRSADQPPIEVWEDNEQTLDELIARVERTLALTATVKKEDVEAKEQTLKLGQLGPFPCTGVNYVMGYYLPNLFFHLTTAYDILRMKGLDVGKKDYLTRFMEDFAPSEQKP